MKDSCKQAEQCFTSLCAADGKMPDVCAQAKQCAPCFPDSPCAGGGGGTGDGEKGGADGWALNVGGKIESAVAAKDGYYISMMEKGTKGGVAKFDRQGNKLDTVITELDEPRGLALSDKSIFVAHNGGVSEYDLVSFENKRTVDVWAKASPSREGRSNGICLNADYTKLYITDPGWKLMPWGADGKNGLLEWHLDSGDVNTMFSDQSDLSPNGCTVDKEGKVWITNMKDGVSTAEVTATGENVIGETEAWSANIKTAQNNKGKEMAGDGIAAYGGSVYVSIWGFTGGKVYKCTPPAACVVEADGATGADISIDDIDAESPRLLLPNLRKGEVRELPLTAAPPARTPATLAPSTPATIAPTAAVRSSAPVTRAANPAATVAMPLATIVSLLAFALTALLH